MTLNGSRMEGVTYKLIILHYLHQAQSINNEFFYFSFNIHVLLFANFFLLLIILLLLFSNHKMDLFIPKHNLTELSQKHRVLLIAAAKELKWSPQFYTHVQYIHTLILLQSLSALHYFTYQIVLTR